MLMVGLLGWPAHAMADNLPWQQGQKPYASSQNGAYNQGGYQAPERYPGTENNNSQRDRSYLPPGQREADTYRPAPYGSNTSPGYRPAQPYANQGSAASGYQNQPGYRAPNGGQPYNQYQGEPYRYGGRGGENSQGNYAAPAPERGYAPGYVPRNDPGYAPPPPPEYGDDRGTYSSGEIVDAGHRFFGKVSGGIARAIESVFRKKGRPNAYILGEEAGGSIVAGLRYGEGNYFTKWGQEGRIYWQGPSIGYDFGAAGAKAMILVYNLRDVNQLFQRFGAVDGQAYLVGGVGITFEKRKDVVLARIQSGVGLRLGANIGYIKYSARPTWNPF